MKEESDAARFKNLIAMYDNMKAKDAAKSSSGSISTSLSRFHPNSIRAECRTFWHRCRLKPPSG